MPSLLVLSTRPTFLSFPLHILGFPSPPWASAFHPGCRDGVRKTRRLPAWSHGPVRGTSPHTGGALGVIVSDLSSPSWWKEARRT